MKLRLEARIYSPRWGHTDMYRIEMGDDQMTISNGSRTSTCKVQENGDREWEDRVWLDAFQNDGIKPPVAFPEALSTLWKSVADGHLPEDQAQEELDALIEWLNTCSRTSPSTDYWTGQI